jgi:hypothetical protein
MHRHRDKQRGRAADLTVSAALNHYLQHVHAQLKPDELTGVAFLVWNFSEQFGEEPVTQVGERHIRQFLRQAKEHQDGVWHWPLDLRRRAGRILREALAWVIVANGEGG